MDRKAAAHYAQRRQARTSPQVRAPSAAAVLAAAYQWVENLGRQRNLSPAAQAFLTASGRRRQRFIFLRNGIIGILAILSIGLATLTGYAFKQRVAAVQQRNQAIGNLVVSEAAQVTGSNVPLAAQLTLAAYRIQPTQALKSDLLNTENTPLPSTLFTPSATSDTAQVFQVAFSPNGHTLASVDSTGTIRLWRLGADSPRPRQLSPLGVGGGSLTSLAFSPNGRILAVGGPEGTVWLWDLADPTHPREFGKLSQFTKHPSPFEDVTSLTFNPSGNILAAGFGGGTIRLWDLADPIHPRPVGRPLISNPDSTQISIAFSPDGRTLASGGSADPIRIWDLKDPTHPHLVTSLIAAGGGLASVAFSPDRNILAAGTAGGIVRLWDLSHPAHPRQLSQAQTNSDSAVDSVTFSPDGHTLASGNSDGKIWLWDITDLMNPQSFGRPLTSGGGNAVDSVAFSPDGHSLAGGSDDGTDRLWNLPMTVLNGSDVVNSVVFSPDGHTLASGDDYGQIRLWDSTNPVRPRFLSQPQSKSHFGSVSSVAFSTDGYILAAGESDHTIRVWDVGDPAHPRPLVRLGRAQIGTDATPVSSVSFSPDGLTLASVDELGMIQLWDIADPAHPHLLGRPRAGIGDKLEFGPHGHILADIGFGSPPQLWDLTHLANPRILSGPNQSRADNAVTSDAAAFSPDGRMLASGNTDSTVQLWNITNPTHPRPLAEFGQSRAGGDSYIGSLAFSPDGRTLASVNADSTIQEWDVTDPAHASSFGQLGQSQSVNSFYPVDFSPNGHTLASGTSTGILLWNMDVHYAIERICATAGDLTPQQWNQYVPQLQYQSLCKH